MLDGPCWLWLSTRAIILKGAKVRAAKRRARSYKPTDSNRFSFDATNRNRLRVP